MYRVCLFVCFLPSFTIPLRSVTASGSLDIPSVPPSGRPTDRVLFFVCVCARNILIYRLGLPVRPSGWSRFPVKKNKKVVFFWFHSDSIRADTVYGAVCGRGPFFSMAFLSLLFFRLFLVLGVGGFFLNNFGTT